MLYPFRSSIPWQKSVHKTFCQSPWGPQTSKHARFFGYQGLWSKSLLRGIAPQPLQMFVVCIFYKAPYLYCRSFHHFSAKQVQAASFCVYVLLYPLRRCIKARCGAQALNCLPLLPLGPGGVHSRTSLHVPGWRRGRDLNPRGGV